jgi:hypothetical protein
MQMKNVTISMDDELYRTTRVEAAKAGKSMSRHIADVLRDVAAGQVDEAGRQKRLLEALDMIRNFPKLPISENGRMPTAEERNARK